LLHSSGSVSTPHNPQGYVIFQLRLPLETKAFSVQSLSLTRMTKQIALSVFTEIINWVTGSHRHSADACIITLQAECVFDFSEIHSQLLNVVKMYRMFSFTS